MGKFRDYLDDRWSGERAKQPLSIDFANNGVQEPVVSDQAMNVIRKRVYEHTGYSLHIPDNFSRLYTTKEGKLAKRIDRLYREQTGVSLSKINPSVYAEIGEIGKRHCIVSDGSIYVDFDNSLRWRQGSYGDMGSCFWGGRSSDRRALRDHHKAWAMRFYFEWDDGYFARRKNDYRYHYHWRGTKPPSSWPEGYIGYARCWLIPDVPNDMEVLITNFYGEHSERFALTIVALLEQLSGEKYDYHRTTIHGAYFFVNHGAKLVQPSDKISDSVYLAGNNRWR